MKVKFGALVVDGRGKLGGHVAAKNRGGAYLRTKVSPINKQTFAQMQARSLLTTFSQAWSALTNSQRESFNGAVDAWSSTNVFGDVIKPSGKTLFVKLNTLLAASGQPTIEVAPAKLEIPALGLQGANFDVSASTLLIVANTLPLGAKVTVSATAPQTAGTSFVKGRYRRIGVCDSDALDLYNFGADYINKFGAVAIGMNIFVQVTYVAANGQASISETCKVNIVA